MLAPSHKLRKKKTQTILNENVHMYFFHVEGAKQQGSKVDKGPTDFQSHPIICQDKTNLSYTNNRFFCLNMYTLSTTSQCVSLLFKLFINCSRSKQVSYSA
jgi:hypothetical protein